MSVSRVRAGVMGQRGWRKGSACRGDGNPACVGFAGLDVDVGEWIGNCCSCLAL